MHTPQDLNRGRAYLLDLASRYGVPALSTVGEASEYIVNMLKPQAPPALALDSESKQTPEHLRRNRFQTVTPAPSKPARMVCSIVEAATDSLCTHSHSDVGARSRTSQADARWQVHSVMIMD